MCVLRFYCFRVFVKASEMETNKEKENMRRRTPITKIPIPLKPLPPLPTSLLGKTNTDERKTVRYPLQTISHFSANDATSSNRNQAQPSSSRGSEMKKKKESLKINTKHVTVRPKNDNLDWNYKVFKDESISVSDDEQGTKELNFAQIKQRRTSDSFMSVTPSIKPKENKAVRNIKRSLKRPHSRELQGLSPAEKQEKKADEKVKRRLQFNDRLHERLKSPDYWKKSYMTCLTRDYTSAMFEYLLVVEKKPVDFPRVCSISRACVVNWLVKINGPDGNPAIVQSAIWYLDSILGIGHVPLNKLQLITAACYWIAQKLHGPVMSSMNMVKCSRNAFTAEDLVAAEKTVMEKLKFPLQPVVPQEFITYLSWWCNKTHPGEIEVASTFLCLSGLVVDKILCEEFPSVIAAAAVRNALLLLGKKELLVELEMCPLYKKAETKTSRMSFVSAILRRAVRTIANPIYDYKATLEYYGLPPYYIAQEIINVAAQFALMDLRHFKKDSVCFKS